ncbi:HTH-type transcriptional repressor KstR [Corynebacterium ciconiae DSM 44920]|uniref:TetR/AcrR family transcriptional regulator n=1 Tax=Corynebacterium ciconiae TaxID=227319 RepID=UPI00037E9158|nr:TetR/AcrR family transcriptional regulator [Corynebacterium ciconiae]WKD61732.1 HTH-type transcriptional repressor KstR [Corynebacterium ciconiae DSM 44920]
MSAQQLAIADAAISVIVSEGFDVVSVRTVATRAGVAPGTVQYYMGTRERLLIAALERSCARQHERVRALSGASTPFEQLVGALKELLPVGQLQREDAALWVVMGAAASTRDSIAEVYRRELELFQQKLRDGLSATAAEPDAGIEMSEVPQTARLITALVNGLTLDYLNAPASVEQADAIIADLRAGLQRILNTTSLSAAGGPSERNLSEQSPSD